MRWGEQRPKLVFIHVPKTGGSSVSRSLERAYRSSRFHIKAGISWRATGKLTDAPPGTSQYERTLQTLRTGLMVHAAEGGTRFLTGHVWYTWPIRRLREDGYLVMTCLRDPVDRLISHYLYNRFNEGNHVTTEADIETFLTSERARQLATVYVRYLSGGREDDNYASDNAVAEARAGLEDMDLVGVLDDLDGFLRKAGKRIGANLKILHRRKSPAVGRDAYKIKSSLEVRKTAQALCHADIEVYEHAKGLANRAAEP